MKKLSFLFILFLGVKSLAIVGGVTMSQSLPEYMTVDDRLQMQSHTVALLNSQNPGSHTRCTGTLIGPHTVLTAAHCIPKTLENFDVVTSIYEFAVSERKPVVDVLIHENYKNDFAQTKSTDFDVALVQFKGELPAGYRPTSWMRNFSSKVDQYWLFVAGYGGSDLNLADSGEIRFSKVTIQNALQSAGQISLVGDQRNGEGICQGDSGGPAYIKMDGEFYVLGIVAAISGGCRNRSYFNQTTYYQSWIEQSLKKINQITSN